MRWCLASVMVETGSGGAKRKMEITVGSTTETAGRVGTTGEMTISSLELVAVLRSHRGYPRHKKTHTVTEGMNGAGTAVVEVIGTGENVGNLATTTIGVRGEEEEDDIEIVLIYGHIYYLSEYDICKSTSLSYSREPSMTIPFPNSMYNSELDKCTTSPLILI